MWFVVVCWFVGPLTPVVQLSNEFVCSGVWASFCELFCNFISFGAENYFEVL